MFKSLIAVILTLVLVFGGVGKPAYALSEGIDTISSNAMMNSTELQEFVVIKATETGVAFFTLAAICLTINGLATTVFPPASALLPFCLVGGGATAAAGSFVSKPVTEIAKSTFLRMAH